MQKDSIFKEGSGFQPPTGPSHLCCKIKKIKII